MCVGGARAPVCLAPLRGHAARPLLDQEPGRRRRWCSRLQPRQGSVSKAGCALWSARLLVQAQRGAAHKTAIITVLSSKPAWRGRSPGPEADRMPVGSQNACCMSLMNMANRCPCRQLHTARSACSSAVSGLPMGCRPGVAAAGGGTPGWRRRSAPHAWRLLLPPWARLRAACIRPDCTSRFSRSRLRSVAARPHVLNPARLRRGANDAG